MNKTFNKDGIQYEYDKKYNDWCVVDCDMKAEKAIILPEIDGIPVTRIEENAFACCNFISHIELPDSLTHIGIKTFEDTEFFNNEDNWEDGLLYIGNRLIAANPDVVCDCKIKNGTEIISDSAFAFCKKLQNISIPNTVKSIGEYAFYSCSSLQSISIPDSVTSIDVCAFSNCEKIQNVVVPDSVKSIGYRAFSGCEGLQDIILPSTLSALAQYAFDDTAYYKDEKNWEGNSLYIGNYLIKVKPDITGHYVIKDGTTIIAGCAFEHCQSVQSISIPASVMNIEEKAFFGCHSIKDIIIPSSVEDIGDKAFSHCDKLQEIVIPNSVKNIGNCAFMYCSALQKVTLVDGLLEIGRQVFDSCEMLEHMTIPETVNLIGDEAFYHCKQLKSIELLCDVSDRQDVIFDGCPSLKTVILGENVKNISNKIFKNCKNIEAFIVAKNNRYLISDEQGVLFNKERDAIVALPNNCTNMLKLPVTLQTLDNKTLNEIAEKYRGVVISDEMSINNPEIVSKLEMAMKQNHGTVKCQKGFDIDI